MGHDEHGPAYPEPPYRCPICHGDESRYVVCEYPGCPDGRDREHPHFARGGFVPPPYPNCERKQPYSCRDMSCSCVNPASRDSVPVVITPAKYSLDHGKTWHSGEDFLAQISLPREKRDTSPWIVAAAQWICVLAGLFLLLTAGPAKPMDHGFDKNSSVTKWMERQIRPDSPPNSCCGEADAYSVDSYEKLPNGDYKVWIQNGDAIKFPDGKLRAPWDVTVPLTVPFNKINPEADDLDNPTDHGWLFMRPSNDHEPGTFYCFIRHPQGN